MPSSLQKLTAFVNAAKYGSFTRAAELMNYSQSGISRMIADLESEWGLTLLERGKGGVRLTSDGVELLPLIERLCNDQTLLKSKIDELNGLQSGLIRIGAFASVAAHWLPGIISEFQKQYPKIDYEIVTGYAHEIDQWILEGRVDCGFTLLPCHPELETIPLSEDRMLGIVPEGHALSELPRFPLADMCEEPFLLLDKDEDAEISRIFVKNDLHPNMRYTVADDYAIMSMVESGLGVSILSELILKRSPYHIVAKELDPPTARKIVFAVRSMNATSLAVKRFIPYALAQRITAR